MNNENIATLTLSEARAAKGHDLWVINTTDTAGVSDDNRRAVINLTVNVPGEEEPLALSIPATWLPQDLGTYTDRQHILSSSRFLKAFRDGYLVIVSEKQADAVLGTSEARSEKTRLQIGKNRSVSLTTGEPKDNSRANVQPWVLETVQRKDLSDGERAALFRTNSVNLKLADIDFALEQLGSSNSESSSYLRKRRLDIMSR